MWEKRTAKRKSNWRNGLNTGDVLPVAVRVNRIFWLRAVIILLAAGAGLVSCGILAWLGARSIGQYLFFQNDLFRLRRVNIECSGEVVTQKHIVEYLDLNNCSNLFAFNLAGQHAALLEKVPWIKSAEFVRRFPGELNITIRERLPVARINMGSYCLTVAGDGCVLGPASGVKSLPVVSGHELAGLRPGVKLDNLKIIRALEVVKACDSTEAGNVVKIAGIHVGERDLLDLTLVDGERVKFAWPDMDERTPSSRVNLEKKLNMLAESIKTAASRGKRIGWLDMTVENNFPSQEY